MITQPTDQPVTRDAEIKYTNSGTAIVKFSIAINRRKKVGESWQDEANFFDINMMGKSAESVHKYLSKGKQVAIQGELRQERWEQDGQARSKVTVFAFSLQLLGGGAGERGQGSGSYGGGGQQGGSSSYENAGSQDEQFEDDIPF